MALDGTFTLEIIEDLENFLIRKRPPVEIRNKLDLGYRIENQDIFLFEIRPKWDEPSIIREHNFAKCTYVHSQKSWKVFWLRASGNWEPYSPQLKVKTLNAFLKLVEEDKHHCFFG